MFIRGFVNAKKKKRNKSMRSEKVKEIANWSLLIAIIVIERKI